MTDPTPDTTPDFTNAPTIKLAKPDPAPTEEVFLEYPDFLKLDLCVAEIVSAEPVEKTDRLVKLLLNIGEPELRTVVAGIREHFTPESLLGKKVTYLANLKPRKMRGIVSQGMILAAAIETEGKIDSLSLLIPDNSEFPAGSKIG